MDARTLERLEFRKVLDRIAAGCMISLGADAVRALEPTADLEQVRTRSGRIAEGAAILEAGGDFGLERIYEQGILPLRREAQEARMARMHEDRGAWFIGLALLLLAIEAVWPDAVRRPRRTCAEGLS